MDAYLQWTHHFSFQFCDGQNWVHSVGTIFQISYFDDFPASDVQHLVCGDAEQWPWALFPCQVYNYRTNIWPSLPSSAAMHQRFSELNAFFYFQYFWHLMNFWGMQCHCKLGNICILNSTKYLLFNRDGFNIFKFDLLFCACGYFCPYVCVHCVCPVPSEARREHQLPWDWNSSCEPPCGCWGPKLGSLEEQSVLLSSEPLI